MFAALLGLGGNLLAAPTPFTDENSPNLARFVGALANIASFWIDYVQTVILSSLIAMLTTGTIQQTSQARFYSAAGFLALVFASYVLISIITTVLVVSLYATSTASYQPGVPLIFLVVAYFVREGIITMLLRALVRTLNASPSELDALIHSRL
jgi:hypothetical protein